SSARFPILAETVYNRLTPRAPHNLRAVMRDPSPSSKASANALSTLRERDSRRPLLWLLRRAPYREREPRSGAARLRLCRQSEPERVPARRHLDLLPAPKSAAHTPLWLDSRWVGGGDFRSWLREPRADLDGAGGAARPAALPCVLLCGAGL